MKDTSPYLVIFKTIYHHHLFIHPGNPISLSASRTLNSISLRFIGLFIHPGNPISLSASRTLKSISFHFIGLFIHPGNLQSSRPLRKSEENAVVFPQRLRSQDFCPLAPLSSSSEPGQDSFGDVSQKIRRSESSPNFASAHDTHHSTAHHSGINPHPNFRSFDARMWFHLPSPLVNVLLNVETYLPQCLTSTQVHSSSSV